MTTVTIEPTTIEPTTEPTTIEIPNIGPISLEAIFPEGDGLTATGPAEETTGGFWGRAWGTFSKWADKRADYLVNTGYWSPTKI